MLCTEVNSVYPNFPQPLQSNLHPFSLPPGKCAGMGRGSCTGYTYFFKKLPNFLPEWLHSLLASALIGSWPCSQQAPEQSTGPAAALGHSGGQRWPKNLSKTGTGVCLHEQKLPGQEMTGEAAQGPG